MLRIPNSRTNNHSASWVFSTHDSNTPRSDIQVDAILNDRPRGRHVQYLDSWVVTWSDAKQITGDLTMAPLLSESLCICLGISISNSKQPHTVCFNPLSLYDDMKILQEGHKFSVLHTDIRRQILLINNWGHIPLLLVLTN